MRGVQSPSAWRPLAARWLVWLWLAAALPLALGRRAWALAPPVFVAPWIDYFGDIRGGGTGQDVGFVVADIDGDGDLDVLAWVPYVGVKLLTNTGTAQSPAFGAPVLDPFGLTGEEFGSMPALADIEGDGDLDVFVGQKSGHTRFFENTGLPTLPGFATPVLDAFGASVVPEWAAPAFADLDGDGDLDTLVASFKQKIAFFPNTGSAVSPAFGVPLIDPFGIPTFPIYAVYFGDRPTLVDIDGDGDFDLFESTLDLASRKSTFSQNTGTGLSPAFTAATFGPFGIPREPIQVQFGDLDDDGDLDLLAENSLGRIVTFPNTGSSAAPAFPPPNPFGLTTIIDDEIRFRPHDAAFADIDGDGDLDAFAGGHYFAENRGGPTSAVFVVVPGDLLGTSRPPTFADIDDDGDLDAFTSESVYPDGVPQSEICWHRNTGTASQPAFAACDSPLFPLFGLDTSPPSFGDIDGDGDLDALIGEAELLFFRNTGSRASPAFAAASTGAFGLDASAQHLFPSFVDVDRDGDLDVVAGAYNVSYVMDVETFFFANTGTATSPSFAPSERNALGLDPASVDGSGRITFADIDGDGDPDAFLGSRREDVVFLRNVVTDLFADGFETGDFSKWSKAK